MTTTAPRSYRCNQQINTKPQREKRAADDDSSVSKTQNRNPEVEVENIPTHTCRDPTNPSEGTYFMARARRHCSCCGFDLRRMALDNNWKQEPNNQKLLENHNCFGL